MTPFTMTQFTMTPFTMTPFTMTPFTMTPDDTIQHRDPSCALLTTRSLPSRPPPPRTLPRPSHSPQARVSSPCSNAQRLSRKSHGRNAHARLRAAAPTRPFPPWQACALKFEEVWENPPAGTEGRYIWEFCRLSCESCNRRAAQQNGAGAQSSVSIRSGHSGGFATTIGFAGGTSLGGMLLVWRRLSRLYRYRSARLRQRTMMIRY